MIIDVDGAVDALKHGNLVAIPTETVYGLAGDASNPVAIAKIFSEKGRPSHHPLIVHIAQVENHAWGQTLSTWSRDVPPEAVTLAKHFWPGPLTMILVKSKNVLPQVTGGQDTVGIRCPDHAMTQDILQKTGMGLVAPSANKFGHVSPTMATHVESEFPHLLVVDGGPCAVGIESTIVDLSRVDTIGPVILRLGAISQQDISDVLQRECSSHSVAAPRVPGAMAAHYAPKTPLLLMDKQVSINQDARLANKKIAWVHFGQASGLAHMPVAAGSVEELLPAQAQGVAQLLYSLLRRLDQQNYDLICFECMPEDGDLMWQAIQDRLNRAAIGSGLIS